MIRRATAADAPAVAACARAAFAPYLARMDRPPAPMTADYAAAIAAGEVHVETGPDGVLRGFVLFRPEGGAMLLETVAVFPEAAGRGIGTAMIAACEAKARDCGLSEVRLYTNAAMHETLRLYPRLGYERVGERVEDGFERVFFAKPLGVD